MTLVSDLVHSRHTRISYRLCDILLRPSKPVQTPCISLASMLLAGSFSSEMTHPHRSVGPSGLSTGTPLRLSKHPKLSTSRHVSSCVPALNTSAKPPPSDVTSNVKPAATVTIVCRPGLRSPTHTSSQPTSTTASPGDDLMTAADRCGADITTGCLSGSCGLCEVRHHSSRSGSLDDMYCVVGAGHGMGQISNINRRLSQYSIQMFDTLAEKQQSPTNPSP